MIQRLTKMVEQKEQNKNIINVLTFDGGGIKGLIICQILLEIEKVLGEPILQYFDWVAGTR
jgi:patatin-like phospholipase/acyl hydrolase